MSRLATALTKAMTDLGAEVEHGPVGLNGETSSASFSPDKVYRYTLHRTWGAEPPVVFVMLNPSTADAFRLDPTVRRCTQFARDWGAGGLVVLNIFALRSTDPKGLYDAERDPVGPLNDQVFLSLPRDEPMHLPIVCAWGAHGGLDGRGPEVAGILLGRGLTLTSLGQTKNGHPKHPLYLKGDTQPSEFSTTPV
jgi:hypothetical protein